MTHIRVSSLFFSLLALLFLAVSLGAQTAAPAPNPATGAMMTGTPPYSTHEKIREDVALATGDLHVSIPVLSLPGRGGQTFNLNWVQDSHNITLAEYDVADGWNYSLGGSGAGALNPFDYIEWLVSPDIYGYVTIPHLRAAWLFLGDYCDIQEQACVNYPLFCNSSFVFRDENGTSYTFSHANQGYLPLAQECSYTPAGIGGQDIHTNPVGNSDQSGGVRLDATNPSDIVIWKKDGTAYHFPAITTWPSNSVSSGPELLQYYYDYDFVRIVDPNGNTITKSGSTITDSTGRTITASNSPTGSTVTWTDSNGTSQTFTAALGGTAGPSVTTHATSCQFNNQYQSSNQTQGYLYNGDIGNLANYATGMTLTFPGGAVYNLQLDQLGKITKIGYPSGGYSRYVYQDWDPEFHLAYLTCYTADYFEVAQKFVCSSNTGSCSGNNPEVETTYTPVEVPIDGNNLETNVVDPLGNRTHYYFGEYSEQGSPPVFSNPRETERDIYQGQSTLLRTVKTTWNGNLDNATPQQVTTIYGDVTPNLSSYTYTTYDTTYACVLDNPKEIDEYDFTGTMIRKTNYTYWPSGGNYTCTTGHILDRVNTKTVTDVASGHYSTTTNTYDGFGNALTTQLSGTGATSLTTQYQYSSDGDVNLATDPKGNQTNYGYANPWYDSPTHCPVETTTAGKPSSVTNALQQTTTYQYYSCTGLLAAVTDPNSQQTVYTYDALGRLTSAVYPDKGNTEYLYVDTAPESVTTTVAITSSLNKVTEQLLDGLGREQWSELTSDPSGTDYVETQYDPLERVQSVSNPYRTTSDTTYGVTQYVYDALGRTCVVVRPDGPPETVCQTSAVAGDVFLFYGGGSTSNSYCTTVTDEAGKSRRSCVDGLGRMTGVWEDPSGLNYATSYTYDGFGDLTGVTQNGGRTRSFVYDGLSRLTSAKNPESGTISYTYPSGATLCAAIPSAVCTRTAPSPNQPTGTATVTATYAYDALNRLTGKSYADQYTTNPVTPIVAYGYDGTALTGCTTKPPGDTDSYPIGRRTSMCDGSGATNWTHDKMGRILQERRTIGSVVGKYDNDAFNLDGSVQSITALGYQVAYTYNAAGQPKTAENFSDPFNYVTSATYAPPGEVTAMSMGASTAPITVANAYNDRLQPLLLSATAGSSTLFSECFDFHMGVAITTPSQCALTAYTTGDNGNVYTIANERTSSRTQLFQYDSLNRIKQAQSSGTQWGEAYTIDAWGNLTQTGQVSGQTNHEGLNTSVSTNNQLNGFGYDTAGNMISNGSVSYFYDAENRLIWTTGLNPTQTAYVYDGDGQRVEKCAAATVTTPCPTSGTSGTLYWRGTSPDAQGETDLSGNVLENYIFFNGQRIARRDGGTAAVHFYFSDHLGTHSVVVNSTGSTCEQDIDYYPFGGQEYDYCANVAQHYKFTGKERDAESGLDNFTARYFGSSLGRFMTPDWSAKPQGVPYAVLGDPQSLNLYAYVRNNPLNRTDPTGHCESGGQKQSFWWCVGHALGFKETKEEAAARIANERNWLINNVARNSGQVNALRGASASQVDNLYQSWDQAIIKAQCPPFWGCETYSHASAFQRAANGALLYRGGDFSNVRSSEYKLDADGNVRSVADPTSRGPSLFEDPAKIPPRFTEINAVTQDMLPPELVTKPWGQAGHFEVVPREPGMSPGRFLDLLRGILEDDPIE